MNLSRDELERIIDDLSQCERRDNVTIGREDYTERSRQLAKDRQRQRSPLITKLRVSLEAEDGVTA